MALARVSSWRCRAAEISGAVLSGRIGGRLGSLVPVGLEGGDDLLEVVADLLVHFHLPGLTAGFGRGGDPVGGHERAVEVDM